MASILTLGITSAIVYYDNINKKNEIVLAESLMDPATMNDKMVDNEITSTPEVEVKEERIEVYEGMTYDELVEKLNRTLSSDLTNMGYAYATYSLELGPLSSGGYINARDRMYLELFLSFKGM